MAKGNKPPRTRTARAKATKKPMLRTSAKRRGAAASRRSGQKRGKVQTPPKLPTAPLTPWAVSPELIALLNDEKLKLVMTELVLGETYKTRGAVGKVLINAAENAPDEGCDALSPEPPVANPWLGDAETCWQFKAGGAGQPAKLRGEVLKPIPTQTLRGGGRFVVVSSASVQGEKGRKDRLAVLVREAGAKNIRTTKIEVFTSETLATWLNEVPAVAAAVAGVQGRGWWPVSYWETSPEHMDSRWQSTPQTAEAIKSIRTALAFKDGEATHVHIFGPPGVGKSRLALEACRGADWRAFVLYCPEQIDAADALLDEVVRNPAKHLVLAVDEVAQSALRKLNDFARRAEGRIRLLTIGHDGATDTRLMAEIQLAPLPSDAMARFIEGLFPKMPREHIDFVVAFSGGYVRLARIAAEAVAKNPAISTLDLLKQNDIRQILNAMLGSTSDRRALYVVAVLKSVGWEGGAAVEGRAVAAHLGLEWADVRVRVEEFQRQFRIAPRGGDLRYITPTPLAIYLAHEAWETFPEQLRTLSAALPTEGARQAFNDRLRTIVASPEAAAFARDELDRFCHWSDFRDPAQVKTWAALSAADPTRAAKNVAKALRGATREEVATIEGGARRNLVWALNDLAWSAQAFGPATLALAELARAENETWANNATQEFIGHFQLLLGGTSQPYLDRLEVIDEVLARDELAFTNLAIAALALIAKDHPTRSGGTPDAPFAQEPEWRPRTKDDFEQSHLASLDRLIQLANKRAPELEEALTEAATKVAPLLHADFVRDRVTRFLQAVVARYPRSREPIRRAVSRTLDRLKHVDRRGPGVATPESLQPLLDSLEDKSVRGQLRESLGEGDPHRKAQDLLSLAQQLLRDINVVRSEWDWLTSGDAHGGWALGEALGQVDADNLILALVGELDLNRPDLRFVAGYLRTRALSFAPGWLDDWLDTWLATHGESGRAAIELTARCPPSDRGAQRVASLVENERVKPSDLMLLPYSGWPAGPSRGAFEELERKLVAREAFRVLALEVLHTRLSSNEGEWPAFESLALMLVIEGSALCAGEMSSFHWAELARRLVPGHAREIARGIFSLQGTKQDGSHWFIEHSDANDVLRRCVDADGMGVWEELQRELENDAKALLFVVGFPAGIIDTLPREAVLEWIDADPQRRAVRVAALARTTFEDGSLGAELLHRYAYLPEIYRRFFSEYVSGAWWGYASEHWEALAEGLKHTAGKSSYAGVRKWARQAAQDLKSMAERDRKREEEERLRGFGGGS